MKEKQRGFVTIATGDEKYYDLASNLLKSYRMQASDETPFAIICDRKLPQTKGFDDIVVLNEVHYSYMEKLHLIENSPYDETIFVDADAFFLSDPGVLWDDFKDQDDFSCYGQAIPLTSKAGWFDYEQTGEYQKFIHYGVQMHGGLYYFRKTELCREVFRRAIEIAEHYQEYQFAHFDKPADEPVLALSMAVSGCKPCSKQDRITFLISHENELTVNKAGQVMRKGKPYKTVILHFATANVNRFMYRYLELLLDHEGKDVSSFTFWRLRLLYLPQDIKIPLLRKIKRFIKYSVSPDLYRKLKKLLKKP